MKIALLSLLLFITVSITNSQTLTPGEVIGNSKPGETPGVALLILNVTHPFTVKGNQIYDYRVLLSNTVERTSRQESDLIKLNEEYLNVPSFGDVIAARAYNASATPKRVFLGTVEQPPTFKEILLPNMTMTQAETLMGATKEVTMDGIPMIQHKRFKVTVNEILDKAITNEELISKTREGTRK